MENVFPKKALHHDYGSRLLPYSLYSRSRCTTVDSTFGKTKLELSHPEELDMEMRLMLLLHVYLIDILLKTSQIVFTIVMISERKYICISFQWKIYYPSVI